MLFCSGREQRNKTSRNRTSSFNRTPCGGIIRIRFEGFCGNSMPFLQSQPLFGHPCRTGKRITRTFFHPSVFQPGAVKPERQKTDSVPSRQSTRESFSTLQADSRVFPPPFQQKNGVGDHDDGARIVNQRASHGIQDTARRQDDGDEVQGHGECQIAFDCPHHAP